MLYWRTSGCCAQHEWISNTFFGQASCQTDDQRFRCMNDNQATTVQCLRHVICLLSVYLVRVKIMLDFLYFNSLVTWKSYAFILLPIYDKYWLRSNRNETIWIYIYHLFYINGWSTVLYNYLFILLSQLHSDTYSRNL